MATIRWPVAILRPQNVAFDIAPRSLAAPASIAGATQVVSSDAGLWKATFDSIIVSRREHVLAFRAIANLLEGRLGKILVPLCRGYQPVPANSEALYAPVPHADSAPFGDRTGYVGRVIDVTLSSSAPLRAVSANVNIAYAGRLEPGQHFSLGERLYRLRTVAYISETAAAITFRPPLREAAPISAALEFDDPVCRMRLATDSEMDLQLQLRRFGRPVVNFVEDV